MAISLEKGKKVNLRKQEKKGLGEILVNLNWNNKPAKKGFLGSLFGGGSKPIDLDLGCLYELKNGRKGTVQALGNAFGSLQQEPYIALDGDDRTGAVATGENLRILLSFVSIPYFTKESVDKEQGIIGQEIGMIEDDPDWVVFMDLMQALYEKHPVRVSVAGSAESISHITAETLYACHKAFYDPSNMVLCVAGDVDPEKICQAAREILPERPGAPVARGDYGAQEPAEVCQPMIQREMEVSVPLFQLGFKGEAAPEGEGALRQQLLGELACEALLGNSGPLYARLYREGLVNRNFSYGYESYPGCAFLCAGGESKDPEGVRAAVAAEAERIAREGIDPELWERLKKSSYGNRVRALNSFEHICISQAQSFFQGCDFLRFPEVYDSLTREDAQAMIARWVTPERTALSVVRPREEAVE